jgi:hypothetical protein
MGRDWRFSMPAPNFRALTSLRRLRRLETDEARRALGEALAQEAALAERDAAMRDELDTARRMTGDFDREAFSAWLARASAERIRVVDALRTAEADAAAARTVLANRRVAETSAEEALGHAVTVRDAEVARRDQLMLEDVARALKRAAEK